MSKAVAISVYLKNSRSSFKVAPASFVESIVDELTHSKGAGQSTNDEVYVEYQMTESSLILEPSEFQKKQSILLRRPPFCPIKLLDEDMKANIPKESMLRGVNIGVAILLQSSDDCVMITRRSKTMRTFPQVWVPPGGHLEPGETLLQAGLRELKEETGIYMNERETSTTLGFWESVYPAKLQMGLPKRHHIVAYIHVKANETAADIMAKTVLCQEEVDACTWICSCLAHKIVLADNESTGSIPLSWKCGSSPKMCCYSRDHIEGITVTDATVNRGRIIPTSPLLHEAHKIERVSTGTKFALELWLAS